MRALILAAGLGTRLRPLSLLCAKPAMPVRGIPVIAHTLQLLSQNDVSEVVINLHHLPDSVRAAVEQHCPPGLAVRYSHEPKILGTGGAIRAVANFLRESDPAIVLSGDMLLDLDLKRAVREHSERGDRYTLLTKADDPRMETFGTLGFDDDLCVRRIGQRFDLGEETRRGLFLGVRIAASRAFEDWPGPAAFEDLKDWLGPLLRRGHRDIRAAPVAAGTVFEPVGTLEEYLSVNLRIPPLSYRVALEKARGADLATVVAPPRELVLGAGAELPAAADVRRAVVWAGERVAANVHFRDGVFAGGRFHAIGERARYSPADPQQPPDDSQRGSS